MTQALRSRMGVDMATVGEAGFVIGPNESWTGGVGAPPLIIAHASGANAESVVYYQQSLMAELGQYFTVYAGDFGFETWGNDTGITRIEAARTYLSTVHNSTGPVVLIGISMGGCNVLNYANTYPGNTKAVIGCIPVTDLKDMSDNRNSKTLIDTAYSNNTTVRDAHSPVNFATTMSGLIPILLVTSSTDATTVPSTADEFVTKRIRTKRIDAGTQGHSYEVVNAKQNEIVRFARAQKL